MEFSKVPGVPGSGSIAAIAAIAPQDGHDELMLTEYVVTRYYRAPEVVLTASKYTYARSSVDFFSLLRTVGWSLGKGIIYIYIL